MTTKTYSVTGMSCSHCVQAVTTELNRLGGQVTIDLVPDGTSQVTVTRHTPLPDAAIRQALSEAGGYQLTTLTGSAGRADHDLTRRCPQLAAQPGPVTHPT